MNKDTDRAAELRTCVIGAITSDGGQRYNRLVLERSPDEYIAWIEHKDSWGGMLIDLCIYMYIGTQSMMSAFSLLESQT